MLLFFAGFQSLGVNAPRSLTGDDRKVTGNDIEELVQFKLSIPDYTIKAVKPDLEYG